MSSVPYLLASIAHTRCAITALSVVHVSRIVALDRLTPEIPHIVGVCNYYDQRVYGLNLALSFGDADHVFDADARMVILGANDILFGLLVDSIQELITIDLEEQQRFGHPSDLLGNPCIRDVFLLNQNVICLVDPVQLFTQEQLAALSRCTGHLPQTTSE